MYCTGDGEDASYSQWGFFKPRYSRGTITLFSNDIEYKLSKVKIDRCGNYIISKIFFCKNILYNVSKPIWPKQG